MTIDTPETLIRYRRKKPTWTGAQLKCGECGYVWVMRKAHGELLRRRRCPKCRVRLVPQATKWGLMKTPKLGTIEPSGEA